MIADFPKELVGWIDRNSACFMTEVTCGRRLACLKKDPTHKQFTVIPVDRHGLQRSISRSRKARIVWVWNQ